MSSALHQVKPVCLDCTERSILRGKRIFEGRHILQGKKALVGHFRVMVCGVVVFESRCDKLLLEGLFGLLIEGFRFANLVEHALDLGRDVLILRVAV